MLGSKQIAVRQLGAKQVGGKRIGGKQSNERLAHGLTLDLCHRARLERDPAYDGRFFFAVITTGIYCRPVCSARRAKAANVRYFDSAVQAATAGFRPCLKCRPERAPGTTVVTGGLVSAALHRIQQGVLDDGSVAELAMSLEVGERRLRRMFVETLGVSPARVAGHRRLLLARQMLEDPSTRVIDVAFASGFNSLRRFNEAFKATFGATPSSLRSREMKILTSDLTVRLGVRKPFDGQGVLRFLAVRAIPGVEHVRLVGKNKGEYARTFDFRGTQGVVRVLVNSRNHNHGLRVEFRFWRRPPQLPNLLPLVERVKQLFDAAFDPAWLEGFQEDATLGPLFAKTPGIRVPGCFDPFELAVRAVLGQQITVAGATTLAGRIVQRWGTVGSEGNRASRAGGVSSGEQTKTENRAGGLHCLFPSAQKLAEAPLEEVGLTRARAKTLRAVAEQSVAQPDLYDPRQDLEDFVARFCELPGIGPWTAHYVALRALHAHDAFPSSDLVLRKALISRQDGKLPSVAEVERKSAAWRPFRAYAGLLLWRAWAEEAARSKT